MILPENQYHCVLHDFLKFILSRSPPDDNFTFVANSFISLTAVQKYAEEAKADFGKSDNGKNVKHTGKQSMLPKELYSEFLDFYVNHTMEETLEKYAKYGYTKASQIKDKLYSIRKELNTYKVKRRNGSVTTVKKNK